MSAYKCVAIRHNFTVGHSYNECPQDRCNSINHTPSLHTLQSYLLFLTDDTGHCCSFLELDRYFVKVEGVDPVVANAEQPCKCLPRNLVAYGCPSARGKPCRSTVSAQ